jgi:hypothetical protein
MTRNQLLLGGACLLLVGLLVGYAAGSGGPDIEDIDAAVAERLDAAGAAEAERLAALETRLGELAGRLDAIESGVASGAETAAGIGERIGGDLAALGSTLGERIQGTAAAHLAAIESGIASLRSELAARRAAPAQPAAPAEPAAPANPAAEGTPPAGQGVGETALLSDGAVRVFVSRVDDAAGSARLAINGGQATLKPGESHTFQSDGQDCRVTLAAIDRGHVVLAGGCGDDLPEPEGASASSIVTLGDGAVRVFVSGVTEQGARLAVNGVEMETVPVGEAVEVRVGEEDCRVSVESIDRGHVALDYACGS